jgi:hypothetical protein
MALSFNGSVLERVASAIVGDQKISAKEAKAIAKTALEGVKNSATPEIDAIEIKNAVRLAIHYAARDAKSAPAAKVLSTLELQIDAARVAREDELAPKFSLADNKKAATAIGKELAKRIASDPKVPELWTHGAFVSIKGDKSGALITYDYEFLAGGEGEYEEVEKFKAYVYGLLDAVPSLKKWKGIQLEAYGPSD